jgi:hypothetical protein
MECLPPLNRSQERQYHFIAQYWLDGRSRYLIWSRIFALTMAKNSGMQGGTAMDNLAPHERDGVFLLAKNMAYGSKPNGIPSNDSPALKGRAVIMNRSQCSRSFVKYEHK